MAEDAPGAVLGVVLDGAPLVVLVLAAVVAVRWLLGDLRTLPAAEVAAPSARVSVVVPARDEETSLPRLLDSLPLQTVAPTDVVVVDDGSHDATALVAARHGATVVDPGAPPPGWTGKAWACRAGVGATNGELLLFLDADTDLASDAVARLLAAHRAGGGLVTVQPFHRTVRPYESLSAYFNVMAVMASAAFTRRPSGSPMAFGPCLLARRDDYEAAGGHAAVRGEILDDVGLARAFHHADLPVRAAVGGSVVAMRSYPDSPGQLVAGWTKNIASGAQATVPLAGLAAAAWVACHHAVAVGTLAALVATVADRGSSAALLAWWLMAWVIVAGHLRSVLRRIGSFRWWAWALFPVPLLAFDLLFVRSAVLTLAHRSVRWRGRVVSVRRGSSTREAP